MSSPDHSSCLIDLSGSSESPTSNMKPLISFPPISADEMIVPLKRFSLGISDPFDTIENQAKLFGDPFEIGNISAPRESQTTAIPTATLIDFEGSTNSLQLSLDNLQNSQDTLNTAMCTITSVTSNSSLVDASFSDTMNNGFLQSDSSRQAQIPNRNRILSDPLASKPTSKIGRKAGSGKRSVSLEQVCLKNQFRKSLTTNSPMASPKANNPADNSIRKTTDFNLTSESIFDDLRTTNPEWIESDNEDSDFERMTIPFLKNIQINESAIASADCSSDRSTTIEKLSKFRKTALEDADEVTESSADSTDDKSENPSEQSPQVDNITSLIETLRNAVKNCGDEKKKDEVSALLDNLNVCFKDTNLNTSIAADKPEPGQIIRQRTFCVDDQAVDNTNSPPIQISNQLSNSLPTTIVQPRKSTTVISSHTPRRLSRSITYDGRPVSVVAAVQCPPNSRERRTSVCTTPTRLVKPSPTRNPSSGRTSLSRRSLPSSPKEAKPLIKPVERKTIMKATSALSSAVGSRPLKLRVGEQTKPSGPLRAVIAYQRSTTLPDNINESTKAKRTVKTSTPLASNNIPKTGKPTAYSTPVLSSLKPPPLTHFGHIKSRLSYTPSTPIANPLVRQPSTETKKRSVTFSEESDKLSQSMIVGSSQTSFPPVPPLQRRRLSRSYGAVNKENSICQKK